MGCYSRLASTDLLKRYSLACSQASFVIITVNSFVFEKVISSSELNYFFFTSLINGVFSNGMLGIFTNFIRVDEGS